ncbi:MAG: HAMP domain-containing sensor histidine kinase, partial [Bacteroidales bacterium]|nr:HAMP domain-containing sensor histidine kinase [Bacteroidales bacterium]
VTICVEDNGDGIDDDVRDKIFRPNFTTKSTGMGLGLAITKTIVSNSGGQIDFKTQIGQGTTFRVELPRTH